MKETNLLYQAFKRKGSLNEIYQTFIRRYLIVSFEHQTNEYKNIMKKRITLLTLKNFRNDS